MVILWDMSNDFKKLKTIPFQNCIAGLYLVQPADLFVAINPSSVYHFNVREHKISKNPVLKLNETETLTGFHRSRHPKLLKVDSCLISSHTGTIYEIVRTKQEILTKPTLTIVHQVSDRL